MASDKPLNNQDLDNLLNALKTGESISTIEDDVLHFASIFNLQPGNHPIQSAFLYRLYKGWSGNPVPKRSFGFALGRGLVLKGNYFYIDKDVTLISEALYKLKSKTPATRNPDKQKHFKYFLDKYKITEGTYWLEGYILFSLYDSWTYKNKKQKPLKLKHFLQLCEAFFETKTINNIKYFQLDKSVNNYFGDKLMEELRNGYLKYGERKSKKKKTNPKV